ncbi:MAG: hypothetical protein QOJ69_442 [Actinomycetota bacterium]|nr:hypothetical protein [Actinomycetota bacterium]
MSADETVFVFAGLYSNPDDAWLDYEVLRVLHAEGVVGTYDAAVVTKDADGKVHVHKHEKPTQHGAWTGVAVGAVIGILFPPSIIGSAAVLGATGGLVGHFWRGLSRGDVKELGEFLDDGDAALVVIGRSKLEEYMDRVMARAERRMAKQIDADMKEMSAELEAASEG